MYFPRLSNTTLVTGNTSNNTSPSSPPLLGEFILQGITPNQQMINTQQAYFGNNQNNELMMRISCLINTSSMQILNINEKLVENETHLQQISKQIQLLNEAMLQKKNQNFGKQSQNLNEDFLFSKGQSNSFCDPLSQKLFGKKVYKYRLQLVEQLPETLYKEKNFDVKVKLVDMESEKIINSNVIRLSFSVCDSNGEWVTENKAKQLLMKGQTEVELYHGEAAFHKLYSREISRKFVNGRLNFVIYVKKSLLNYSNSSSCQVSIKEDDIEPLILHGIRILSKKI